VSREDATHINRNAFTLVEASYELIATECLGNEKKCKTMPRNIKVNSMQARGSGVIIEHRRNSTYIMTAGHVCEHSFPDTVNVDGLKYATRSHTSIRFFDLYGSSHEGRVLYSDMEADICIVESPGQWGSTIRIADSMPRHGARVFNTAAPFGIYSPKMVLIFEGFYSGEDMTGNVFFTLPCRPGSSGSPVYNSDGELISIIHSASVMFENLGLGSRLEIIKEAIKAHIPPKLEPIVHYMWYKEVN
tara:strand:+ start:31922 stop:32659 length:738 start_codon:yes stop_codon:yes gene_type:complete